MNLIISEHGAKTPTLILGGMGWLVKDLTKNILINPAIKVIISSGNSLDAEASQIIEKGCNGSIQELFGIQELSQKIREVLSA